MSNVLILPQRPRVKPCVPFASASNTQNVVSLASQRARKAAHERENAVRIEEDPDGSNALFSANWASTLGPKGVEQYRLGWHRLIHPADRFEAVMARHCGMLRNRPFNFSCRYWVFGDYHPVWFSGAPLRYERGRAVRWGGFWIPSAAPSKRGGTR